jgi:hypothetical protein
VEVTGVVVVATNGSERIYVAGRSFDTDGYGDYVIFDGNGGKVGTRKRGTVEEVYLRYGGE